MKQKSHPVLWLIIGILTVFIIGLFYFYPRPLHLPEQIVLQLRTETETISIEEESQIQPFIDLLGSVKLRRELVPYDGLWPKNNVQADQYVIIEIYDGAVIHNHIPAHFCDISLVKSDLDASRLVWPSTNNRNKRKLVTTEETLQGLIQLTEDAFSASAH